MSRRPRGSNISPSSTTQQSGSTQDEPVSPPFFNTTYTTHRITPLFVGSEGLTETRLELLARRLRDTLVGDVVRGIQISLEASETPQGQVGLLRSVKLRWFQASDVLGDDAESNISGWDQLPDDEKHGLWIEIRHENAMYVALLLPGPRGAAAAAANASQWQMQPGENRNLDEAGGGNNNFVHLPLLLMRMPAPLKTVIGEWLSSTFDCHVSKLALGTKTVVNIWEDWIETMGLPSTGPDFQITLSFNAPLPDPGRLETLAEDNNNNNNNNITEKKAGLRSLDIIIRPSDLRRFVRAGKQLPMRHSIDKPWTNDPRERRRLAGNNSDDGWAWRRDRGASHRPFTEALAAYLDRHLALDLFHPSVRVTQISCRDFVLGLSRVKIMNSGGGELVDKASRAAWMFVGRLGERGVGDRLPVHFS